MGNQEVFGAFASVCIRVDGDLMDLSKKLSSILKISDFRIEPNEYPPHNFIGSAEALGWELWLEATDAEGEFKLRLETEHAVEETFHGRMHDLSPWLARFLAMMGDFEVMPVAADSRPS